MYSFAASRLICPAGDAHRHGWPASRAFHQMDPTRNAAFAEIQLFVTNAASFYSCAVSQAEGVMEIMFNVLN